MVRPCLDVDAGMWHNFRRDRIRKPASPYLEQGRLTSGWTNKVAPGIAVLEIQGIPAERRESTRAALVAGGQGFSGNYEAWIVPARRPPGYFVRIIGARGFYREAQFTGRETEAEIVERVRETMQS
jgi:hypothetical protein